MQYILTAPLILFALTTNVYADVYAECAWVLWIKYTTIYEEGSINKIDWDPKSGFSQLDQCRKATEKDIEESIRNVKQNYKGKTISVSRSDVGGDLQITIEIQGKTYQTIISRYKCLPDIVKP